MTESAVAVVARSSKGLRHVYNKLTLAILLIPTCLARYCFYDACMVLGHFSLIRFYGMAKGFCLSMTEFPYELN